jgi:hypothetical protein
LNDRAWDGVEPLLAIADLAGGDWPGLARAACVELFGCGQLEDESIGVQLRSDIREVFGDADRLTTSALLDGLNALDESPWGDWYGKELANRGLAKLLQRYGIKPRSVRIGDAVKRGFQRDQFTDAWARYRPNPPRYPLQRYIAGPERD